jgi:hypothetical protein
MYEWMARHRLTSSVAYFMDGQLLPSASSLVACCQATYDDVLDMYDEWGLEFGYEPNELDRHREQMATAQQKLEAAFGDLRRGEFNVAFLHAVKSFANPFGRITERVNASVAEFRKMIGIQLPPPAMRNDLDVLKAVLLAATQADLLEMRRALEQFKIVGVLDKQDVT